MDNFTQQQELLMQYLDGDMSQPEREEFEKRLSSDESLRLQLEDLQTAREAIKMYGLKQQVAAVHRERMEEIKPEANVRKITNTRRIARFSLRVAAGIVLVAICFLAYNFFSLSSGKLYNENYNSFELSSVRGDNETRATEIEKAYWKKNYQDVIALSSKYPGASIKDEFLEGMSFLELDKPSDAIDVFINVLIRDQNSDHEPALRALQAGGREEARLPAAPARTRGLLAGAALVSVGGVRAGHLLDAIGHELRSADPVLVSLRDALGAVSVLGRAARARVDR